jgi:hypothetical protein
MNCVHCGTTIQDMTTMVTHGNATYCCANCANAMEQEGSGSDPHAMDHANDLVCRHCGTPIVDESTLRSLGNDAFCCDNCYAVAA